MTNATIPNKFPGVCTACGGKVPAQAGAWSRDTGLRHRDGACGAQTSSAVTSAALPLTAEQQDIETAAKAGGDLCIEAFAGAGKTHTLRAVAAAMPGRSIVYTAFNRGIVTDGQGKFGPNVRAATFHSLALNSLPRSLASAYRSAMNGRRMNGAELSGLLGTQPWTCRIAAGKFEVPRSRMAEWAALTVLGWMTRDRAQIEDADAFAATGLRVMIDPDHGEDSLGDNWLDLRARIAAAARTLWADLADPATSRAMSRQFVHAGYLKAFALSGLPLPCDTLLVDEAQDLDPVMLQIIDNTARAGTQVILVGDSNQAIYEWRGAVNALERFSRRPNVTTLRLTSSFRFGEAIAAKAQVALDALRCPAKIVGAGKPGTVGPLATPHAVLCRTNAAVVRYAIEALRGGGNVGVVGGVEELVRFATACQALKDGGRTDHPDLQVFTSWVEVQDYADTDAGADLRLMVDLIDSLTPAVVLSELSRCGDHTMPGVDVVVGTAHKTKGLEWPTVQLGADWKPWTPDNEYAPAELRLLYVAMTRAKVGLDTGPVFTATTSKRLDAAGALPVDEEEGTDDTAALLAPWQPLGDLAGA